MGVLMVLVALALPPLAGVRLQAVKLRCVANLAETGRLVTAYAGDHHDTFPCRFEPPGDIDPALPEWVRYRSQSITSLPSELWLNYTGLDRTSGLFRCPANRLNSDESSPHDADLDYVLTESMYADPRYFAAGVPEAVWSLSNGGAVQRVSSVVFPSSKAGAFETDVWHGWDGQWCDGCDLTSLEYHTSNQPGSVWFFDGHGDLIHARDALPWADRYPIWPWSPFGTTIDGVLGRDAP